MNVGAPTTSVRELRNDVKIHLCDLCVPLDFVGLVAAMELDYGDVDD